jgi:hypothetical protein
MIVIDMALLPPAVQRRIKAALAAGDTIVLAEAGTAVATVSRPAGPSRGFQVGDGNTQINQF